MSEQEKKPRFDREAFAAFDGDETVQETTKKQEKKTGRFWIMAALAVCLIGLGLIGLLSLAPGKRPATTAQTGIGVIEKLGKDEDGRASYAVVHTAVDGFGLMETVTSPASQTTLSSGASAYLTQYRGRTYYYDASSARLAEASSSERTVYQGAVRQPFYDEGYVYFIDGGEVAGQIYRTPLKGGELERVLPVKTTAFILYKGQLIYYDPAINAVVQLPLKEAIKAAKGEEEASSAALGAEVLLADTYTTVFGAADRALYFLHAGDKKSFRQQSARDLTGYRLCRLDLATGDLSDVGREVYACELVVTDEALYYSAAVNGHVYRCNLQGADIRDLTGGDFAYPYALTVSDGYLLFRAFHPQISEEMQTTYEPIIGVCTTEGERLCAIYAASDETGGKNE